MKGNIKGWWKGVGGWNIGVAPQATGDAYGVQGIDPSGFSRHQERNYRKLSNIS